MNGSLPASERPNPSSDAVADSHNTIGALLRRSAARNPEASALLFEERE